MGRMTAIASALVLLVFTGQNVCLGDEEVAEKFNSFCAEWMKKLEVRERENRAAIRWQAGPSGVQGDYVGYSREHSCELKAPDPKSVPIGKIRYRELLYRKAGLSRSEAEGKDAEPVEATEVTEIFRYANGKWVY